MLKVSTVKTIDLQDWDSLVEETYGKPYSFQQQDDCKARGTYPLEIASSGAYDHENDTLPELVNHQEQGVSFKAWLERDPTQKIPQEGNSSYDGTLLWWERNFYPEAEVIAQDLLSKGLVEEGSYVIRVDW
tara:strand:- start:67 stop:459 length:393 start_codon:yes stop_codon:yes gene_type:complete